MCSRLSVSHFDIPVVPTGEPATTCKPAHIDRLIDRAHLEALRVADPEKAAKLLESPAKESSGQERLLEEMAALGIVLNVNSHFR